MEANEQKDQTISGLEHEIEHLHTTIETMSADVVENRERMSLAVQDQASQIEKLKRDIASLQSQLSNKEALLLEERKSHQESQELFTQLQQDTQESAAATASAATYYYHHEPEHDLVEPDDFAQLEDLCGILGVPIAYR